MMNDLSISQRRTDILERIANAAKWANRDPSDITLIGVSKLQPSLRVKQTLASGHLIYGENRVQEALQRWDGEFAHARDRVKLHLIGPLQTNKAEHAVRLFDIIQTLDRERLARAIATAAQKLGRMPILYVQLNLGREPQKAGIAPDALPDFLKLLRRDYDIHPKGLMCIPPQNEAASPYFWWLADLAKDHGLSCLSMGMSADFETAIKMGATHIRVGSALFGPRPIKAA